MKTYPIMHYKKGGSDLFVNGGKLTISEKEYAVHYLFKEVARFSAAETTVTKASWQMLYDGIKLTDGKASIELYFAKETAEELWELFKL